jgi:agmatine deiminase
MAWPCRLDLWGQRYDDVCRAFALVARSIAAHEPVKVLAPPQLVAMARLQLARMAEVVPFAIDDSWSRDTCPSFVTGPGGAVAGVAWHFNGWGNRQHPHEQDARLAAALLGQLELPCYAAPLVLEGGAVEVDGQGTLLAVEPSILNPNRNPTLDRRQVDERLALCLGVRRIVWLEHGLVDDATDGHVDNVARFAAPGQVLAAVASDPADRNANPLAENLARLRAASDAAGRPLRVAELPLPAPRRGPAGQLALSYVNFYIANGAVVMPAFGDPMDGPAREIVAAAFPDRQVVQLQVLEILHGGGGIHCITQQQPQG